MTREESGFTPAYGSEQARRPALVFPFAGEALLVAQDFRLPPPELLDGLGPCAEALTFGHVGVEPCELRVWPPDAPVPAGLAPANYRQLWSRWPAALSEAAARALQLATWLRHHRYCGACGAGMVTRTDEPARECPGCGHKAYPRISPVCIGLVLKGDELLLGRSPHFPPGVYSALAGFLEAGESAEDCLRREIREEAGIEIENIRWFGSQSWPFPHSLMMGFIADYAGGELRRQVEEIEDLRWFRKDGLPQLPHPSSIAYRMIRSILAGPGATSDQAHREIGRGK